MERMPGKTPWTVSVSAYPGTSPCPELERLDLAIKKSREWREEDEMLEVWKSKIEWAEGSWPTYGTPVYLNIIQNECDLYWEWLAKRTAELFPRYLASDKK